jgi:hypothetical protein
MIKSVSKAHLGTIELIFKCDLEKLYRFQYLRLV